MKFHCDARLKGAINFFHHGFSLAPFFHPIIFFAIFLTISGCGSSLELTSRWTNQAPKIDGSDVEWQDATAHIAGPDVLIGIKNDNDNLYMCISTVSRTTEWQMLALGTTIWFDTEGKKNKSFGIQFPISTLAQGRRLPPDISQMSADDLKRFIDLAQRQFEILGPGAGEHQRISLNQGKGIDVHLGYSDGKLSLELKVPLHKSGEHPYAINAAGNTPLSIGLETGDYADAMRSRQGAGGRGSGVPSGGRGGRGGGGQAGGGMGGDAPEPLKHWLVVHMAGSAAPN
jgi:hypothetical protein